MKRPATAIDLRKVAYGVLLVVAIIAVVVTYFYRRWRGVLG